MKSLTALDFLNYKEYFDTSSFLNGIDVISNIAKLMDDKYHKSFEIGLSMKENYSIDEDQYVALYKMNLTKDIQTILDEYNDGPSMFNGVGMFLESVEVVSAELNEADENVIDSKMKIVSYRRSNDDYMYLDKLLNVVKESYKSLYSAEELYEACGDTIYFTIIILDCIHRNIPLICIDEDGDFY